MRQAVAPDLRPQRADARRNRERVLKAARVVFAEHGRDAQIDDIARRAKVGVGTVYRHFPTKEALIEALVLDAFGAITAVARAALAIEDPWEAFEHVMWRGAEIMASDRALSEVIASEPGVSVAAAPLQAELAEVTEELMRRARLSGQLRPDAMVDDIPMIMCGIGGATKKQHACANAWRRHLAIVLDGLRAHAASGPLPR